MATHDAIVIGAGPSGTWVADHLVRQGKRVLLIDGGPRVESRQVEDAPDTQSWPYETSGANCDWLRVRAVGGASLVWGGWSQRFPQQVFDDGAWPYDAQTLAPFYQHVEQRIGVHSLDLNPILTTRMESIGLHTQAKRMARFEAGVWNASRLQVSENTRANTIAKQLTHDGNAARAVVMINEHAEQVSVRARAVVLAASPVETARLLLASDVEKGAKRIGAGLVYHPIVGYALIHSNVTQTGGWSASAPTSALLPRFVNTDNRFRRDYRGGFSVEIVGPQPLCEISPGVRQRIDPTQQLSDDVKVTLIHGICETMPHLQRYVCLSRTLHDRWGRQAPRIHCAWADADHRLVADAKNTCLKVAELLSDDSDHGLVQYLDPFAAPILFHEAGTCAMGADDTATCDPWGKLRALKNVWVADASALPSAGDRHPTLTIMAHAARAAVSVGHYLANRTH